LQIDEREHSPPATEALVDHGGVTLAGGDSEAYHPPSPEKYVTGSSSRRIQSSLVPYWAPAST
jgi:hypothetical protein